MQRRSIKIVGIIMFVVGLVVFLSLSIREKTNWGKLMKKNIEALTTPEDNPYYPCVHAKGYCFMHGIEIDGVALK